MRKVVLFRLIAIFSVALLLHSCSKKQEETIIETSTVDQESLIQGLERTMQTDIDMVSMQSAVANNPCSPLPYLSDCVTVEDSGQEYPRTIILDYGDGCEGPNGHVRAGIIHIEISAPMYQEGAERVVTFEDFSVDNHPFSGTRVTTNTGVNEQGHPTFSRSVDVVVSLEVGDLSRSFQHNVEWLEGYDTDVCFDNVFLISGSGTIIRPNNSIIQRTILEPLLRTYTCNYITSGVLQLESSNGLITIDFGDGNCDNIATVTSGDESWEITL